MRVLFFVAVLALLAVAVAARKDPRPAVPAALQPVAHVVVPNVPNVLQPIARAAAAAAPAGAADSAQCKLLGGECLDSSVHQCSAAFVSGVCPGNAHVKCCPGEAQRIPNAAPVARGSSECAKRGGSCMDTKGNSCKSGFKSGLCPGAVGVKCCLTSSARPPVLPTPPASSPVHSGQVTFDVLRNCYPQGEPEAVKARIGRNVNADWITNTCAIRMSHTLNCAGVMIPVSTSGQTIKGSSGWNYIFRVKQVQPLLKKLWGNGMMIKATNGVRGVDKERFAGRKGLVVFDTTGAWDDATGHLDLWDGKLMVEQHHADMATVDRYFSLAVSVTLYEFP